MTVDRKLRLRLELIAALPEPILLERLRRLSQAELIAFRRRYGIRECRCKGKCRIRSLMLDATRPIAYGISRRLAARLLRDARSMPHSMFQTRCQCQAAAQRLPPIPFSAQQLLAEWLPIPEGETRPMRPRTQPNKNRGRPRAA